MPIPRQIIQEAFACQAFESHPDNHPRHKSSTLKCFGVLVPQELEKFKFVLDYKIKELKKQIEPKEEQIADMKDQVKVRCAALCCAALCCAVLLCAELCCAALCYAVSCHAMQCHAMLR